MLSKCELNIINNDKLLRLASICVRLHVCAPNIWCAERRNFRAHPSRPEALRCHSAAVGKCPKTGRKAPHEQKQNGKQLFSVNSFSIEQKRDVLFVNYRWFQHETRGYATWGPAFPPFALLTGLLMWVGCQAFDIQDGGMLLWKQLVAAFRSSVAWAGARQAVPNVLVDSEQNKCGFHQKSLGQIRITPPRLSLSNTEGN